MPRTVSISWLMQMSGSYALKCITIYEDTRAFDSMSTFRDEDARWLTRVLGAHPHVELSGRGMVQRTSNDYPGWALDTEGHGPASADALPLDWERAGATFLRHVLDQLIESRSTDNVNTRFQELVEAAKSALLAIDAETGTYFTLDEARTVLDRRHQQAAKVKRKH